MWWVTRFCLGKGVCLQRDLASPDNHIIPCEVIRSYRPLLVMPYLPSVGTLLLVGGDWLGILLDVTHQLLEVSCFAHTIVNKPG